MIADCRCGRFFVFKFAIHNPQFEITSLCSMPYALLNLKSPDLVIDRGSFKRISLAILLISTYYLPGGSQHEYI
jgi:hypothetical protein